jgi:enterobacteria phage integrase
MGESSMTVMRLAFVKEYTDRTGKMRRYFRKRGCKTVALPGAPGSPEFMRAYQTAMGSKPEQAVQHDGAGTVTALIVDYLRSPSFASNLKPSTKRVYRIVLDRFRAKHGHRLVVDMPRDKVAAYIYEIGAERPAMANLTKKVLRKLLAHAVRHGWRNDNPVTEIDNYKLGSHHTWSDGELRAFEVRWPLGTRQRLAYALLLYTGQRVGDVAKMRRQDISGGCIAVTQEKTGAELSIPIHPVLAEAMQAGPNNGMNLIGDRHGRPIGGQALSDLVIAAVKAAGLPPKCVPHGLRKAMARRLAEGGATAKEIASVSGHKSLREIQRYTDKADQRRLSQAAMNKLETPKSV